MVTPTHIFDCSCGTTQNSRDADIPVGWSACGGNAWCADCTRAGVPQQHLRTGQASPRSQRQITGEAA